MRALIWICPIHYDELQAQLGRFGILAEEAQGVWGAHQSVATRCDANAARVGVTKPRAFYLSQQDNALSTVLFKELVDYIGSAKLGQVWETDSS